MEFFTIGVYNSKEKEFFDKLTQNNIDTLCDIRQRRGVRGSKYSFVNYNIFKQKLKELEIKYLYTPDLAPTSEIRELQKQIDIENKELKSERKVLGKVFVIEYKNRILQNFEFNTFLEKLEQIEANRVALFCVEENPKACHRSIVANKLTDKFNFKVIHL